MTLRGDTVLQRVPDLQVRLTSSNVLVIHLGNEFIECGPHGLAALDVFYQPKTLSEGLELLDSRVLGVQDYLDLMDTVLGLYHAGVLRVEGQDAPTSQANGGSLDTPSMHVAMLHDQTRTASYLAAIREVVQPGDVVVDIGTGTGVLAVAAAQAGAARVYAIEASSMAKSAQQVFEANGVANRVTLLHGWSTQLELPERADVLVSEIIGNEPLAERVLEVTSDAVKRLLKPGGRLVPRRVKLFGLPVSIPDSELRQQTFMAENVQQWSAWYSIAFGPLVTAAEQVPLPFWIAPAAARDWTPLSNPVLFADLDLAAIEHYTVDVTQTTTTTTAGRLHGVVLYFELELGPTTRLTTHPALVNADSSWRSRVWLAGAPLDLEQGEPFHVTYRRFGQAERDGVFVARVQDSASFSS